jgi:hypothetical protein
MGDSFVKLSRIHYSFHITAIASLAYCLKVCYIRNNEGRFRNKVLTAAKGDAMCTNLLFENKVFGYALASFIGVYFRCIDTGNVNHLSSALNVCEIIELSIHMEEQCGVIDASSKHRYQTLILDFAQHQVQHYENVSASKSTITLLKPSMEMIQVLQKMFHCCITLQGDTTPSVLHSSILQQILDLIPG